MLYNLQYRDLATLTTTTVTGIDALFYDVIGLASNTQYEFRVQEDDGTSLSPYSDYFPFTTAESNLSGKVTATIVIESLITASVKAAPLITADVAVKPIITASAGT